MLCVYDFFFFTDTATTEIYTLSLHDALPIWLRHRQRRGAGGEARRRGRDHYHGEQREEARARQSARRDAPHQLQQREFRRQGDGDHRRPRRRCGHGAHRRRSVHAQPAVPRARRHHRDGRRARRRGGGVRHHSVLPPRAAPCRVEERLSARVEKSDGPRRRRQAEAHHPQGVPARAGGGGAPRGRVARFLRQGDSHPLMLPRIHILGTGGSISAIGPHRLDYTLYPEVGKKLTVAQMLERIPEARELAELTGEDVLQVGSPSIGPKEWLQLADRIHALSVDGVVITHGTATLEETAYFLHLAVKSDRPVVVTGAMRPPSALGTDADLNLLDAIRLAAAPEAGGRGVLTILNNEIQSARDVTKSNAFRVDTFESRDFGMLGYVDSDARVLFHRSVTRPHTVATPFDVRGRKDLPRVDIVYAYAGADGLLVDALTADRKR